MINVGKRNRLPLFLASLALLLPLLALPAWGNSAEPPCFTVLVIDPPEGLTITLVSPDNESQAPLELTRDDRAWESYYRFYYWQDGSEQGANAENATLTVSYGEDSFTLDLPDMTDQYYNNLLTLDIASQTLTDDAPAWRTPLLVALRVLSTLVIEGVVFFLFGFREGRSWLVFLGVNLATQLLLNWAITGSFSTLTTSGYWWFLYIFGEVLVFAAETVAFGTLLKENGRGRAVGCALTANAASLVLGGLLLTYLPV
ncbi:MAG: hypothetical protein LUH16_05330 [Clostridiales bacterium]|nr:hypothetical protein [Clostridiales bacterium]